MEKGVCRFRRSESCGYMNMNTYEYEMNMAWLKGR